MPAWATVILTLGVATITGLISYVVQRAALMNASQMQRAALESQRQVRYQENAYREYQRFMLAASKAVDATIFAVRNVDYCDAPMNAELVEDALEKVRQFGVFRPLVLAYAKGDGRVENLSLELLQLLRTATYSLRRHVGLTSAQGEHWSIEKAMRELRPRADELQELLSLATLDAVSRPGLSP